jgi:hypothetical protein
MRVLLVIVLVLLIVALAAAGWTVGAVRAGCRAIRPRRA